MAVEAVKAAQAVAVERAKKLPKFYYGRPDDTPWNWDLNWKTRLAKEKREMQQMEDAKASGVTPSNEFTLAQSFGVTGTMVAEHDIPPRPAGKKIIKLPHDDEPTAGRIFPELRPQDPEVTLTSTSASTLRQSMSESALPTLSTSDATGGGPNGTATMSRRLQRKVQRAKLKNQIRKERRAVRELTERANDIEARLSKLSASQASLRITST